jgi:hypothetical protein
VLKEVDTVSLKSGTVEENSAARVSTNTGNNASAQVLQGEDLDALGDNPEDLAEDLQRLARPSAGPSGRSDLHRWI